MRSHPPFQDASWLQDLPSPYYNASHRAFQSAIRDFIDENLNAHALTWERQSHVPHEVYQFFAKANLLVPNLPAPLPVKWLKKLGLDILPGELKAEEFDDLHAHIYFDEVGGRN